MTAAKPRRPAAPRDLDKRGRRFWRLVVDEVDLDVDGLELLAETCRTLDTLDRLRERIESDGYMVRGSMGQERLHPAVPELRAQRRQAADFMGRLGIEPDEEFTGVILAAVPDPPASASHGARQAARRAELKKQQNSRRATNAANTRWRG